MVADLHRGGYIYTEVGGREMIVPSGATITVESGGSITIDGHEVTELGLLTTDHGALTGLEDDDHPQYALADGSRGATCYHDFVLTNDQIIHLPTTPVLIVPPPGAGLTLMAGCTLGVGEAAILLDWYGDYATVNAGITLIFTLAEPGVHQGPNASYGGFGNPLGNMLAWGAGGALNPQWLITPGQATTQADSMNERDYWDNQGIWISMDNQGDGILTGGHASNKLYGRVWYRVIPTLPAGFSV